MTRTGRWILAAASLLLVVLCAGGTLVYREPLMLADQQVRFHLWRSGVESKYIEVDGNRLHYLEASSRTLDGGTPLVLIHGLGARGEDWSPLVPGLAAAGFHVYVPDLLGYGRSAHPDVSYSIGMQEKVVAGFMEAVHVRRADVAGWSMGGWIAMKLALDDAARVDRLILFDAAGIYFPGSMDLASVFDVRDVAGVKRLFDLLTPHPKPIPDFVAKDLARKIHSNSWVVKRSLAAMMSGHDLMDFRLYAIRQPTLIVWGKQDQLIPLSSGEELHRGIKNSSLLIVDGCGHLAPAECSKASLRETITFLRAQPPISGIVRTVDGVQ